LSLANCHAKTGYEHQQDIKVKTERWAQETTRLLKEIKSPREEQPKTKKGR
jgi:hypothetical protein